MSVITSMAIAVVGAQVPQKIMYVKESTSRQSGAGYKIIYNLE